MIALDTEAGALAGLQGLPAAAVGGRYRGCGPARQSHVPAAGHIGRFVVIQRYCPAADRDGAGVGYIYIDLVTGAPITAYGHRTAVRAVCLADRRKAGQQHCELKEDFHWCATSLIEYCFFSGSGTSTIYSRPQAMGILMVNRGMVQGEGKKFAALL